MCFLCTKLEEMRAALEESRGMDPDWIVHRHTPTLDQWRYDAHDAVRNENMRRPSFRAFIDLEPILGQRAALAAEAQLITADDEPRRILGWIEPPAPVQEALVL